MPPSDDATGYERFMWRCFDLARHPYPASAYPRTQTIISCVLPKMIDMRTRVRMRSLEKDRVFV